MLLVIVWAQIVKSPVSGLAVDTVVVRNGQGWGVVDIQVVVCSLAE